MPSRSRPEWLGADALGDVYGDDEVLPAVSTSSVAFQAILDDLVRAVDAPAPPVPPAPTPAPPAPAPPAPTRTPPRGVVLPESDPDDDGMTPLGGAGAREAREAREGRQAHVPERLRGRGDLTLVVGLGGDADAAARILAASAGAEVPVLPVPDRRAALAARADGVRTDRPVVGIVVLPGPLAVAALAADLAGIEPDQVWAAVDASRKEDDTAAWVSALDAVLAVDAVAATNAALTASPLAVERLGPPVLWLDAPPAAAAARRIG